MFEWQVIEEWLWLRICIIPMLFKNIHPKLGCMQHINIYGVYAIKMKVIKRIFTVKVSNKQVAKVIGIITFGFCLILVANLVFNSFSVNNQQPVKVYKVLTETEEKIVDENIKRLKELQHINYSKNEVAKSEREDTTTDTIDVEPIEKQDKVLQEGDLVYGKPVSKEEASKLTRPAKPEIRDDILDFGNGHIIDRSKVRVITPEELGATPVISTNIEDLQRYIAELEARNDPAAQPMIDVMRRAVNATPLPVTTKD